MSDGECRAFDPECCDSHSCGVGDGDCDPGTCPNGLTCGKNNFLEYHPLLSQCEKGWTKHAEVCIAQGRHLQKKVIIVS